MLVLCLARMRKQAAEPAGKRDVILWRIDCKRVDAFWNVGIHHKISLANLTVYLGITYWHGFAVDQLRGGAGWAVQPLLPRCKTPQVARCMGYRTAADQRQNGF